MSQVYLEYHLGSQADKMNIQLDTLIRMHEQIAGRNLLIHDMGRFIENNPGTEHLELRKDELLDRGLAFTTSGMVLGIVTDNGTV